MAYSVKYSKKFQRMGDTATYRVDILSEAGGAVVVPDRMGADPLQIKTLSSERDDTKIVIGSECTFEFVLIKRTNEALYAPLFESEYRDHIVKYYNDDTSTLLWQGYLQPENMAKGVFDNNLHIYLSATDALKDLSEFQFLDSGSIVTGRKTALQILKICLTNLDTDNKFQYNFIVKLGTKHTTGGGLGTGMGANDNALHLTTYDTRRFANVVDGTTEIDSCLEVIEKVLRPFNCTLSQYGGKYYVKHLYEKASDYYTYNWALAFQGKAAASDSVTIDTMKFRRDAEQSFLSPVKEIGIKLLNRNIGGSLVPDINDFNELTGPWDYSNYDSGYFTIGGQIRLTAAGASAPYPASNGYITLSSGVNIERVTAGDYMKLRFSIQSPGLEVTSDWPQYRIIVVKNGVESVGPWNVVPNGWSLFESPLSSQFQLTGSIGGTLNYNVRIEIGSNEAVNDYECYLKDFDISRETIVEGEVIGDITFDRFFKAQSNKGKRRTETVEMYFADTSTLTDFAALAYDSVVTSSWTRYGKAETIPLLQAWAKDYLLNRQQYINYVMLQVKDTTDAITPVKWISFAGKNYQIVSYEKSFRTSWVSLHLKQILDDDITLTWGEWPLTTVDGQGGGATPYTPPAVTNHNGLSGLDYASAGHTGFLPSTHLTDFAHANIANGQTAFGWGNHASAGYAPTASPTFTGNVALPGTGIWNSSGSVGIGTTSPATKLHIKQDSATLGATLRLENTNGANNSSVDIQGTLAGGVDALGKISFIRTNAVNSRDTDIAFSTYRGSDTSLNECFRIKHNGNVGIGTTSPAAKLAINGGLHVGGDSDPGDNNLLVDGEIRSAGDVIAHYTP